MKFEVFIPGKTEDDFDITLKIKANSWVEALKAGLSRMGEDSSIVKKILVDIMEDNTIHVTETVNNRVFRITELEEEMPVEVKKELPKEEVKQIEIKKEPETAKIEIPKEETPKFKSALDLFDDDKEEIKEVTKEEIKPIEVKKEPEITKVEIPVIKEEVKVIIKEEIKPIEVKKEPEILPIEILKPVEEKKKPEIQNKFNDLKNIEIENETKIHSTQEIKLGRLQPIKEIDVDSILTELYFDITDIDSEKNISKAMEIAMDLSMKYMDCESGSVFLVDIDKNDLYFSAIRGPKADDLKKLNIRIPMGIGIVGFCSEENVSLALSDVNRDPRFYRSISQKLGYPTYSILCVPMFKNGRVYGAIQLINKKSNNTFTKGEIAVIDYIATHVAEYLDKKFNIYRNF